MRDSLERVLQASDDELNAVIESVEHDPLVENIARGALQLSEGQRRDLLQKLSAPQPSPEVETKPCTECGKTMDPNAAHQLYTEADSGMCWECWLLVM